ncbi:hypothetical protein D9756_005956 [Leucocoprinus leucothites]|uniref:DUF605-domain-containing protein n=1 Tax=Leucocoprinus leucothites TaxID=201217 RepID=A0A8H5D3S0_9AGAR|nr:hypothetical protein D9756_005956 [Leucoagaricus leucothites]
MTTQKLLGLPPISSNLRPIVPFLQRAEELRKHEPIIAYWCAYYAAQVGIGLKARDNASREILFALLGILENMKKEIGSIDAIEIEAASAAFVENFALRVFQSADNEDRRGAATRTTAKKFLAASNFLEVLKTFPKADVSESNEDKIRYAKWKAADISKALREGQKPIPGPAGQEQYQTQEDHSLSFEQSTISQPEGQFGVFPQTTTQLPSPPGVPRDIHSRSPPKNSSGHRREGSGSSTHSISPPRPKNAWVSDEVEGKISPSSSPPRPSVTKPPGREGSPEGKKRVHFSSSANVLPSTPELSPKAPSPAEVYQGPPSIYAVPSERRSPSPPSPPSPPSIPHTEVSHRPSSYSPPQMNIYASPGQPTNTYSPPNSYSVAVPPPPPPASAPTSPPQVELTPQIIAKAQKHCRFAISSLDYEDAEQAKKELRIALGLLGGL